MAHRRALGRRPEMAITRRDVDSLYGSMRDAHGYIQSQRDNGKSRTKDIGGRLLKAGEVAAGAATVGLLVGRLNHWNIPNTPIPVGLAIGAAGHLIDFFGVAGDYGAHVANFADGAFASWATMLGAGYGTQMRQKAGLATPPITAGRMGGIGCCGDDKPAYPQLAARPQYNTVPRPTPMTEAELVAMSSGIR